VESPTCPGARGHRSRAACRLLVATAIAVSATFASGVATAAADTSPLVQDSLNALDSLMQHCQVMDALDNDTTNGNQLPYRLCDDGQSAPGQNGIPVPIAYSGDQVTGLPAPASPAEVQAANARDDIGPEPPNFDRATLDVHIALPPASMQPPPGGFPVLVLLPGSASNRMEWRSPTIDGSQYSSPLPDPLLPEAATFWHRSDSWYAARGYIVLAATMRLGPLHGSTAKAQFSRRYEVNDVQYLLGLLADDDVIKRQTGQAAPFNVNPAKVGGVAYSGGSMLTLQLVADPEWKSPATQTTMDLAAVAPSSPFTDFPEIVIPSGHYFDRNPSGGGSFIAPTSPSDALSRNPVGVQKTSFWPLDAICADVGSAVIPSWLTNGCRRIAAGEPYSPDDQFIKPMYDRLLADSSPYLQPEFWSKVQNGLRVPIFDVQGANDPLTPEIESIRYYNKLKSIAPNYPIKLYVGTTGHLIKDKLKEWADLCGADRHVCTTADFTQPDGTLNFDTVPTRVRKGISTRINEFLDYNLRGLGTAPTYDVTATTTICAANATAQHPADEPGTEYNASTWQGLINGTRRIHLNGGGTTSSDAPDPHGAQSDPQTIGEAWFAGAQPDACYTTNQLDPGPGVVQLRSEPLSSSLTMLGIPTLRLSYTPVVGNDYYVVGRLYDLSPNGSMTLVTRGICRTAASAQVDCSTFDLWGNMWEFPAGHQVVLELSQADKPFFRPDNLPSSLAISGASVELPVRTH
jgi:X-Pro dipeptidyl-peptidase-like protein